jgi:uncharacterized lipoprotein YddW (UPF0748 family)
VPLSRRLPGRIHGRQMSCGRFSAPTEPTETERKMNAMNLRRRNILRNSLLVLYTLSLPAVLFLASGQAGADEARHAWFSRFEWNDRQDIEDEIANIADCNMNGVLFQVRGEADAFYISTWEPWSHLVGNTYPGYDPLAVAIYEAHRQGLELHAYVNAMPMWGQSFNPASDRHIWNAHPDWVMVDASDSAMSPTGPYSYAFASPGVPQFQEHLSRVIMDIAANYDVDGIHLDYIRYPHNSYSYDDSSLARFEREYGCGPDTCTGYWALFRRDLVTEVVKAAYDSVTALKPWVKMSAAVWGDHYDGYVWRLQDSHTWLDSGFVDFNCPMIYTEDTTLFQQRLHDHAVAKYGRHVYGGIGAYLDSMTAEILADEIGICRSEGVEGQALFAAADLYGGLKDTLIGPGGPYASPAAMPAMAWKSSKPFTVSSVLPVSATQVDVQFSADVDQTTAEDESNYTFDSGLTAAGAARDASDHRLVHLTTNTHYDDFIYTLTVSGVASEGSKETVAWPNNVRKFHGKNTASPPGYIVDNGDLSPDTLFTYTGYWRPSTAGNCYNIYKLYHAPGGGDSTATWTTAIDSAGNYAVFFWVNHGDYTSDARYIIHTSAGPDTAIGDQRYSEGWNYLGTFPFADTARVTVTNEFTTGEYVIADAIQWLYVSPISSQAPPAAVNDLAADKSAGDIVLTWTAVTADTLGNPETVDGYIIYRNSDPSMIPGDSVGTTSGTEYTDPGAAGSTGTNYYYVIKAVDDAQAKSDPSNAVGEFDRQVSSGSKAAGRGEAFRRTGRSEAQKKAGRSR